MLRGALPLAPSALLLTGCISMGNTDAVKSANELAIGCQTDEALAAVDRATRGGGLGATSPTCSVS
jgi:hypothetical protein